MLETLDIFIGFSVVMLTVSMAVTVLTEAALNTFNMRAHFLKGGLTDLLALLDRGLGRERAAAIATCILKDPLVAGKTFLGRVKLGTTIHREEFVKLVLDFAVHGDATKAAEQDNAESAALQDALKKSIKENGIDNPADVLRQVRLRLLELEHSAPELSVSRSNDIALLTSASSEFLAKSYAWFDQTIDRVSERFAANTRLVTGAVALFVALTLQLDTGVLFTRLGSDDALRTQLVQSAIDHPERYAPTDAVKDRTIKQAVAVIKTDKDLATLVDDDLIDLPTSLGSWWGRWTDGERTAPGVLLTALLLSLGGPFWYAMLKNFLNLRSMIARKDDTARQERQGSQLPATGWSNTGAAATLVPVELAAGERGDPEAVG